MDLSYHIGEVFTTALLDLPRFPLFLLSNLKDKVLKGCFAVSNCFKNFDATVVLDDTVYIVPLPVAVNSFLTEHLLEHFRSLFFGQSLVVRVALRRLNFSEDLLIALFLFKQKLCLVIAYCKLDLRFILRLSDWTIWLLWLLKSWLFGLFFKVVLILRLGLLVMHVLTVCLLISRLRFLVLVDLIDWRSV
jgi:hypothetical protein